MRPQERARATFGMCVCCMYARLSLSYYGRLVYDPRESANFYETGYEWSELVAGLVALHVWEIAPLIGNHCRPAPRRADTAPTRRTPHTSSRAPRIRRLGVSRTLQHAPSRPPQTTYHITRTHPCLRSRMHGLYRYPGYWSYALCTSRACLADFAHSMQSPPPHVPIPHAPAASATRHAHPQSAQAPPCLRKPPWQVRTQTATAALARRPARTAPTTRSPRRWGRSLGRPR